VRAPITYVHDNLVFGRDRSDAWALYELAGVAYPYLAHAGKLELFARVEALLYRLEADVQLLRVSRAFAIDAYAAGVDAAADPRHRRPALLDAQLAHDRQLLAARPASCPEIYLAVALAPPARGLAAFASAFALRDARALSERVLRTLQAAERRVFERVDAYLQAERASTEQIQWLVRRAYCRGLGDPPLDARHRPQALTVLDADGARGWRPARVDVHRWHDALLERGVRTLRAHTECGVSHQAQLVLGALPEQTRFPGEAELLFAPLERLPFAVDACLHARWLPNRDAVALAGRRRTDAENALEEEAAGLGAPSSETLERPAAADELEHRLTRPDRPPLLRAAAVLSVGAGDEATLAEHVERVRIEYGTVALHRPAGEQHRLFLSTLPAQRAPLDDYADHLLLEQVAAMMPVGVDVAGSELGPYLGHTLSAARRPVRLDLADACRSSRAPTVLLLGTLGSGKTVALQALAYRAWTLGSGPVVDIDPKGDHHWERLPGVRADGPDADLEIVELSAGERYRGLLDPLRIGEPGAREDLAYAFLVAILPQPVAPQWQTELRLAVSAAVAAGAETCAAVLDALAGGPPAARDCARALAVHARAGLVGLAFADPDRPPPDVGARDIVCLRLRHLRLPPPGRARGDADEEERIGTALLRLLAAYALRLTATDPERHSIVSIDEAWALLEHAPEVVERLGRLGRSQNVTPLLASQRIGDVDALDGLVGTCLVFGLDSDAEAEAALRLLRQDPSDETLRRRLLAFRRGRCLLLDADGRLTALQVEITDPALLAALDTTPGPRALDAAA
jgi:hypothetical protein